MITLSIPEASPSLNELKGKHWSHHQRMRRHWSMLVLIAKNEARVSMAAPPEQVTVQITREGRRKLDEDNLAGGLKCLIDSLREQRLIVNDDPQHMTLLPTLQVLIPKTAYPRTLVQICGK